MPPKYFWWSPHKCLMCLHTQIHSRSWGTRSFSLSTFEWQAQDSRAVTVSCASHPHRRARVTLRKKASVGHRMKSSQNRVQGNCKNGSFSISFSSRGIQPRWGFPKKSDLTYCRTWTSEENREEATSSVYVRALSLRSLFLKHIILATPTLGHSKTETKTKTKTLPSPQSLIWGQVKRLSNSIWAPGELTSLKSVSQLLRPRFVVFYPQRPSQESVNKKEACPDYFNFGLYNKYFSASCQVKNHTNPESMQFIKTLFPLG